MKNKFLVAIAMYLVTFAASADTYVPAGTRITQIATTQLFMQKAVIFKLDKGTSDCAAGSYVYYYSNNIDDLKTVYASVVAAYMSSTPVIAHFQTVGCVVDSFGLGSY
jgi:hypothetical protein